MAGLRKRAAGGAEYAEANAAAAADAGAAAAAAEAGPAEEPDADNGNNAQDNGGAAVDENEGGGQADFYNRVKVYHLVDGNWDDVGTGHITYNTGVGASGDDFDFAVHCEDTGVELVSSSTSRCAKYSLQQGTLVCWTEPESHRELGDPNGDYALSFQELASATDMWRSVCRAKGVPPEVEDIDDDDNSDDDSPGLDGSMVSTASEGDGRYDLDLRPQIEIKELPPPDVAHLEMLADEIGGLEQQKLELAAKGERDVIRDTVSFAFEKYGDQMLETNFVEHLIETFRRCEDLEDVESLRHIYRLAKGLFAMCNSGLFEIMFDAGRVLDVIGMFEYPPEGAPPTRRHRDHLTQRAALKEAVPLGDDDVRAQIHLSYRLQYIRDVIFAGYIDDYLQSMLNSYVMFMNVEVCTKLYEDERFMDSLFDALRDTQGVPVAGYVDRMKLVKELLSFGRNLQQDGKLSLYTSLKSRGIFGLCAGWIGHRSLSVRQATLDILLLYNHNESGLVRAAVNEEGGGELLAAMATAYVAETSAAVLPQLMSVLRCIVDVDAAEQLSAPGKTQLLSTFYEVCMPTLMVPLGWDLSSDYNRARHEQVNHAMCMLSYTLPIHTYHVKNFVLRESVLQQAAKQATCGDVVLELAAVRVLRVVVGMRNEFYNRHIVSHDLLAPVVARLVANGDAYNLINSSVLELLEFVRKENIKTLVLYLAEKHGGTLKKLTFVDTPAALLTRHEQNEEALKAEAFPLLPDAVGRGGPAGAPSPAGARRDDSMMDREEESYWDKDDDDDDNGGGGSPSGLAGEAGNAADGDAAASESSPPPAFRKRLVNYDDDDDDEGDALFALAKKAKQGGAEATVT